MGNRDRVWPGDVIKFEVEWDAFELKPVSIEIERCVLTGFGLLGHRV